VQCSSALATRERERAHVNVSAASPRLASPLSLIHPRSIPASSGALFMRRRDRAHLTTRFAHTTTQATTINLCFPRSSRARCPAPIRVFLTGIAGPHLPAVPVASGNGVTDRLLLINSRLPRRRVDRGNLYSYSGGSSMPYVCACMSAGDNGGL
jgi:hypothetical protein